MIGNEEVISRVRSRENRRSATECLLPGPVALVVSLLLHKTAKQDFLDQAFGGFGQKEGIPELRGLPLSNFVEMKGG